MKNRFIGEGNLTFVGTLSAALFLFGLTDCRGAEDDRLSKSGADKCGFAMKINI